MKINKKEFNKLWNEIDNELDLLTFSWYSRNKIIDTFYCQKDFETIIEIMRKDFSSLLKQHRELILFRLSKFLEKQK